MKWVLTKDRLPDEGKQVIFDGDEIGVMYASIKMNGKHPSLLVYESSGEEDYHDIEPYYRWLDESKDDKKGKYVSRAVYAKLQAEKNRLLKDIETMCNGGADGGVTWQKWRKHFKIKYDFANMLREILTSPQKDLTESKIDSAKGAFK